MKMVPPFAANIVALIFLKLHQKKVTTAYPEAVMIELEETMLQIFSNLRFDVRNVPAILISMNLFLESTHIS